ncbi:uncharacterized protein BYT42DRAFT_580006 [Radiomyces spectabilis]|uniref:uncharacterized protein n=1 Tax=Radiomyces spectabilis TaxID=64574 RepID=UPI00221FFEC5|nr:uncharacterized protein BYT42DRAFT_580006 [Radiomyces spectabilis]KAI8371371.1 hypothetical protein BYT42DRAFT_580006 [Radiomyces spectabilis]
MLRVYSVLYLEHVWSSLRDSPSAATLSTTTFPSGNTEQPQEIVPSPTHSSESSVSVQNALSHAHQQCEVQEPASVTDKTSHVVPRIQEGDKNELSPLKILHHADHKHATEAEQQSIPDSQDAVNDHHSPWNETTTDENKVIIVDESLTESPVETSRLEEETASSSAVVNTYSRIDSQRVSSSASSSVNSMPPTPTSVQSPLSKGKNRLRKETGKLNVKRKTFTKKIKRAFSVKRDSM